MAFQPQPQRSGLVGVLDPGLISALSDSSMPRACFTPQARAPLWLWVQASSSRQGCFSVLSSTLMHAQPLWVLPLLSLYKLDLSPVRAAPVI